MTSLYDSQVLTVFIKCLIYKTKFEISLPALLKMSRACFDWNYVQVTRTFPYLLI